MQSKLSFPARKRLKGRTTIQQVFQNGTTLRGGWLQIKVRNNGTDITRFGCTTRRHAVPNAVLRNRVRRLVKESLRQYQHQVPLGLDLMVVVYKKPEEMSLDSVCKEIYKALKRLDI